MSQPDSLPNTKLFGLVTRVPLRAALQSMRSLAETIAGEAPRIIPQYTDHSLRHMDHLAELASVALTPTELEQLSEPEAFILLSSFYLHDLGMTAPVLPDVYRQLQRIAAKVRSSLPPDADDLALLVREYHADLTTYLGKERIATIDRYFIEDSDVRHLFADAVAVVSASHGWPLARVDDKLGRSGKTSFAPYGSADLAYVACLLRVIDYMDITARRAPHVLFRLRRPSSLESIKHWLAQANLTDPIRESDFLKFTTPEPVADTDAWWLAWDLCRGLASELQSVRHYLADRSVSQGRYSLAGVVGTDAPESFAQYVRPPEGVLPVDVRVSASSMEKVIDLLGGQALYGHDKYAPVRELIQNARDAILTRQVLDTDFSSNRARISLTFNADELSISDNGIGMSLPVIKDHLLGIGASYWRSRTAEADFGTEVGGHAGRFGIGFISTFIMASTVSVGTRRADAPRYDLTLMGLDHRGHIKRGDTRGSVGTTVRLRLREQYATALRDRQVLVECARARAPMLSYAISVTSGADSTVLLAPEWWRECTPEELGIFLREWHRRAWGEWESKRTERRDYWQYSGRAEGEPWPFSPPRAQNAAGVLIFTPEPGPLLLCSLGLALLPVTVPGLTGMVELGDLPISASRGEVLENVPTASARKFLDWCSKRGEALLELGRDLHAAVSETLPKLAEHGMIPRYHSLINLCRTTFGDEILENSALPWMPLLKPPGDLVHMARAD